MSAQGVTLVVVALPVVMMFPIVGPAFVPP